MLYKSLYILGRQPAIGRAELESLLGAEHLQPIGEGAMATDLPVDAVSLSRLGGSIRSAEVLAEIESTQWPTLARDLQDYLARLLRTLPEGKLKLGLSAFGLPVNARQLLRTGLELKKVCKRANRSVRLVPNTELALSSAQVLHNQLTGAVGVELLLLKHGSHTILARTVAVQDINAYAARDQGRPKRDARVGMLPPKLAQIIVNLATGQQTPDPEYTILDPFCGTGVILQEALLMGFSAYGTDLEPRMMDYTAANIDWLRQKHSNLGQLHVQQGDATNIQWQHTVNAVACETYLGRPLSTWPPADTLHEIMNTCNLIIEKALQNLADQLPAATRLCLALPAWRSPEGRIHHLSLLDRLSDLRYNAVSFEHVRGDELVYFRPDQLVARQLLVITRK